MGKHLTLLFANNKGADQPALTRSLISTIVVRFLEKNITPLAEQKISILLLVFVT